MSTAAHVAARPAVALPSLTRLSLSRTGLELKSFFRRREAVVFTFSLPVVLLIIFGSIFHGTVGVTGVSYRLYFTAGIIASGIMSTTFVNLGISIVLEREDGTLKRLAGHADAQGRLFRGQGAVLPGHRGDRGRHPARHRHRALRAQAARAPARAG